MRLLQLNRESYEGEELLETVEYFVKKKDWVGAVQLLDQLIQNPRYTDSLAYGEGGLQFNLRERARVLLFALPQIALDHYTRLRHVDASLLLKKAGQDKAALRKIVDSYPVPRYLARASLRLASLYFEEGRINQARISLSHCARFGKLLSPSERQHYQGLSSLCKSLTCEPETVRSLSERNYLIVGSVALHLRSHSSPQASFLEARSLVSDKVLWRKKMASGLKAKILVYGSTVFSVQRMGIESMNVHSGQTYWARHWRELAPQLGPALQFISPDIHCVGSRLILPIVYINQQGSGFYHYCVLALNLDTGKIAWKRDLARMSGSVPSQFSMTLKDGVIYGVTDDGLFASIDSESGRIQSRRRYLTLASFNARAPRPYRALARVAPKLRALRSFGDRLYFYNSAFSSLMELDRNGGRLLFKQSVGGKGQIVSFHGRHVNFDAYVYRSPKQESPDLRPCFCKGNHLGPCPKLIGKPVKKSRRCTIVRRSP